MLLLEKIRTALVDVKEAEPADTTRGERERDGRDGREGEEGRERIWLWSRTRTLADTVRVGWWWAQASIY